MLNIVIVIVLSVFTLAERLQLILEISITYRLAFCCWSFTWYKTNLVISFTVCLLQVCYLLSIMRFLYHMTDQLKMFLETVIIFFFHFFKVHFLCVYRFCYGSISWLRFYHSLLFTGSLHCGQV